MATATRLRATQSQLHESIAVSGAWDSFAIPRLMVPDSTVNDWDSRGSAGAQYTATYAAGQKAQLAMMVSPPMFGGQVIGPADKSYAFIKISGASTARVWHELYVVSQDGTAVRASLIAPQACDANTAINGALRAKAISLASVPFAPYTTRDGDRVVSVVGILDPAAGGTATILLGKSSITTDTPENETSTGAGVAWLDLPNVVSFYYAPYREIGSASGGGSTVPTTVGTPSPNSLQILIVMALKTAHPVPSGLGIAWSAVGKSSNTNAGTPDAMWVFAGVSPPFPVAGSVSISGNVAPNTLTCLWGEQSGIADASSALASIAQVTIVTDGLVPVPVTVSLDHTPAPNSTIFVAFNIANVSSAAILSPPGYVFFATTGGAGNAVANSFWRPCGEQSFQMDSSGGGSIYNEAIMLEIVLAGPRVFHPPVWTLDSPPSPGPLGLTAPVVVRVTDVDDDLVTTEFRFDWLSSGINEVPYIDGVGFVGLFVASSTRVVSGHDVIYTFNRTGGWVDASLSLHARAVDATGNVAVFDGDWTTGFAGTYSCGVDQGGLTGHLQVTIISPTVGSRISRDTPLIFDVEELVNGVSFRRALPTIIYPNLGRYETIHDGETFTPSFNDPRNRRDLLQSTPPKYRFTAYRPGGWPDTVIKLLPSAFDTSGSEQP